MWRLVQKPVSKLSKGLAIGWGVPQDLDAEIRKALPFWSVMVQTQAPRAVTFSDYATVRRLTMVPRTAPLIVFGVGAGCLSVRTVLLAGFVEVWAAAAIGLPGPDAPLDAASAWKADTWKRRPPGGLLVTSPAAARAALGPALGLVSGADTLDAGGVLAAFCRDDDPRLGAGGIALMSRWAGGRKP